MDVLDGANHFLTDSYSGLDKQNEEAKAERLKEYLAEEAKTIEAAKNRVEADTSFMVETASNILVKDEGSMLKRSSLEAGIFGDADKYL
jgi:hypothetical protein